MKQKTKGFLLLFTKKELADIDKKAKKMGVTRTDYLRKVLKEACVEACPTTQLLPYLDEIQRIRKVTDDIKDKVFKSYNKETKTYYLSEEDDKLFLESVARLKEIMFSVLEITEDKYGG